MRKHARWSGWIGIIGFLAAAITIAILCLPQRDNWKVIKPRTGSSLSQMIRQEIEAARKEKIIPIVYIGAIWCSPCKLIKKVRKESPLKSVFSRVYIIELDIDDWTEQELQTMHYRIESVPGFHRVNDNGEAVAIISGGAWRKDTPANIAAVLTGFFAATSHQ